jgi:hypothetical protein
LLAEQGDHVRVGDFFRLDFLAVMGPAVQSHVFRSVHCSEGVPERLFSER